MKIYVAHSRSYDFIKGLYNPIKNSRLFKQHTFIFPHSENSESFSSKEFFLKDCDLVIAEVPYPSTGLGIELGWADVLKIPIACIYKNNTKISDSIRTVTKNFLAYSGPEELIAKIKEVIQKHN